MSNTVSYQEFLNEEARALARRRHPVLLVAIFLVVFFALQYAWEMSRGSRLEQVVIDQATVAPAAWIINSIWSEQGVTAQGHRIVSPHGRLNILNGCEGLETLFLLLAAIAAYPFTWRAQLQGLGLGLPLVFVLNQARIVILWHAFLHDRALFGVLHGIVLPLVLVAICFVFFLAFMARHEPVAT
ncbi:MAG: exosortase/archaeosortase family protein [Nitrosomonadales bacterium]|nr:MAG: exosortase/archaeosortase family protein [Nitrosomonadales bacterium]